MESVIIHVRLTDEPVAVWRPVAAVKQASSVYKILAGQPVPEGEEWEFPPGSTVLVEDAEKSGGPCKIAAKLAPQNSCRTYFKITGNFEPDEATRALGLSPDEQWRIGDARRNGTTFDFAMWRFGLCEEYNVLVEEQMMATIRELLPKTAELRAIKEQYDAAFTLVIVPTLYPYDCEPAPRLAPCREVVAFCHETETDIDIDLYVYDAALMEDIEERRSKGEKDADAAAAPRLRYTLTEEAYLDFNIYHMEHSASIRRQARRTRILPPLLWLLLALCVVFFFDYGFDRNSFWFPAIVTVVCALWFLLYPTFRSRWLRKAFATYIAEGNGKEYLGEVSLELRDDGLRAESGSGVTEARYTEVSKLVENKGCLYIYIGGATAYIIPLEAFGGDAAYRTFREALERKRQEAKERF